MSEKLKPCPFCGSENIRFESEKHAVVCVRCKARGSIAPSEDMSRDMWNYRVCDDHIELTSVNIGKVATFPDTRADKGQALKVLEEAAEMFGALQALNTGELSSRKRIDVLNECADVIQAVANLIDAMGERDFAPYMDACRKRNEKRGRL